MGELDLKELVEAVEEIEAGANTLLEKSNGIPAIERNVHRILTSTKLLKINVCDVFELSCVQKPSSLSD